MFSGKKNKIKVNEVIFEHVKQLHKHKTKAELRELTGLIESTFNVAMRKI